MKKGCAILALAAFAIAGLGATPLERARAFLAEGEIAFLGGNDEERARAAYATAESEAAGSPESTGKLVALAEINLARGELSEIRGEKKSAASFFGMAYDLAEEAYRSNPNDSEACRVAADCGMRILPYRSLFFKATHGFTPLERAKRAREIDPSNESALFSLGLYFLFCPKAFGGNPEKARAYFGEYAAGAREDLARFKGSMWLAIACRDLGDFATARKAFGEARKVFPESGWLEAESAKLAEAERKKG